VDALFPTHPPTTTVEHEKVLITPKFTEEELKVAVHRMPNRKAAGPDGIPNEVVKLAASKNPKMFLNTFNYCIKNGHFPKTWKSATLILIKKGVKP